MPRYIKYKPKPKKIEWLPASDVQKRISKLVYSLQIDWIKKSRIFSFRSENAKTHAYARIWGLGRIWQKALDIQPAYIIEVISEKFDKLSEVEKDKVLIHEIGHIPRNFSGSLIPHTRRGKRNFKNKVDTLVSIFLSRKQR